MIKNYKVNTFTSESVSEGHPDKICDQISDAILDAFLAQDPDSKVACEVMATKDTIIVAGEVTSTATVDIYVIVRELLFELGYTHSSIGIDYAGCKIVNLLHQQSKDILLGIDHGSNIGAGDQGSMFGYADNNNSLYMPLSIVIAHEILKLASFERRNKRFRYARPDMKTQVTLDCSTGLVDNVVISIQHEENYSKEEFSSFIKFNIVDIILKKFNIYKTDYKLLINSTGRFVIGGPAADTGLTGRKIIVDTYGGYIPHGGGAFSGKDGTKVDRSGAYMARFLAKNIVASGISDKCQVQLSYAIGIEDPISIHIDNFHTENIDNSKLGNWILKNIDLTPKGIIDRFNLKYPIFKKVATYGHFGRNDLVLPWEELTLVDELKNLLKTNYILRGNK